MQKNKRRVLKALARLEFQVDKVASVETILDAVVDLKNFNVNRANKPNRKLREQIQFENHIVNAYQNLCVANTIENQKYIDKSITEFRRQSLRYLKTWR